MLERTAATDKKTKKQGSTHTYTSSERIHENNNNNKKCAHAQSAHIL